LYQVSKGLCTGNIDLEKPVEMKEMAVKYGTDVITSCAFGIQSNCLLDANAVFHEFGRKIVEFSVYRSFEFMSIFMLPLVSRMMNIMFFSD
jgi:cytochrome P450 family 6